MKLSGLLADKMPYYQTVKDLFEKRIRIKDLNNNIVPLVPNAVQIEHERQKHEAIIKGKNKRFLVLKARRLGITTWEQANNYAAIATRPNVSCATIASTQEDTQTIFRIANLMANLDTRRPCPPAQAKDNIEFKKINSRFLIGTAGKRSFGRGDNLYRVHGSEVAHWSGNIDVMENLMAGLLEAARNGTVTLETTARGASGYFYELYKEAMEGKNQWVPLFYPWFSDPRNYIQVDNIDEMLDTLTDDENHLMNEHNVTLSQIKWRREKQKELKGLFKQENPENWSEAFIVRGYSYFDPEMIGHYERSAKEKILDKNHVTYWKMPEAGHEYMAGADTAEGNANSDFSVCGILDKATGEQVAVLRGRFRTHDFAKRAIELCHEYNDAVFCCEINNHGHSVMNTVLNVIGYKKLFQQDFPLRRDKYDQVIVDDKGYGWRTTAQSRDIMLSELREALEQGRLVCNDSIFLSECKTFVDVNNKYQAKQGAHDDSIFAWGIAWQCRKHINKSFNIIF